MPDFIASIFSTIHNFLFAGGCILITLFVMAIVGAISDKDWDALKAAFFAPGQTLRFSLDADHDGALFSLLHFVVSLLHPFFFIGYVVAAVYCIYQLSCRALSSGKHHLSFGVLDPMGAGPHLLGFVRLYLRWAVDAGYMTPEEKEQELDFLHAEIKQVG